MTTPPPSNRADGILDAALEHEASAREAFIIESCGENAALLAEVRALLAAHEAMPTDFLAVPAVDGIADCDLDTTIKHTPGTRPPVPATAVEHEGERIGRYKLLQNIGEGGFGTVWMAEQMEPVTRRVALKIIKLGMDTREVIARFEAERQALAMMDHPNIAKVLDAGATDKGRPFFVMELVKGMPITQYCDEAGLGTRERLALFGDVCSAINHAHQKGVIHRDIKPSNVMVTLHGDKPVVKVIDFGIAKATQGKLTDKTLFTRFEQFIGTPVYMSPEQASLSGLDIDTRSDIYALGILLYELLTGKPPFDAKTLASAGFEEMRRIIREVEPPKPSLRLSTIAGDERTTLAKARRIEPEKLGRLVESDLDWIVMKAIEKDRARRYETANAFAQDIAHFLADEPVVARSPNQLYRLQKAFRRNKLAFGAAAVVVIALVMGLGVAAVGWRQARAERDGAERARKEAETAREGEARQRQQAQTAQAKEAQLRVQAEAQELAARRRAYAADMNLIQQALAANNLKRARYLLDRHRPKGGEKDLRGWEWRYLWQRCQGNALFKLYQQPRRVVFAGFSSDGKHVAIADETSLVSLLDVTTKAEVNRLQGPPVKAGGTNVRFGRACFSDDGELLAAVGLDQTGRESIKVWNMTTQQLVAVFLMDVARASRSIAFSPDKKTLAAFDYSSTVSLWNIATNQKNGQFTIARSSGLATGAVSFSPDGIHLAIGDADGRVRLFDSTTFAETASFTASTINGIQSLAFSPDGRVLAAGFAFNDSRIVLWDVRAKSILRPLDGHKGFVAALAFSPNGQTLASASGDQTIKLWNTTTWMEETTLMGHVDEVWSVAFSRDGKTLMSSGKDGSVYVWPANGVSSNHASLELPENSKGWDLSPDGKSLAVVTQNGGVSVWDVATGQKKVQGRRANKNQSPGF